MASAERASSWNENDARRFPRHKQSKIHRYKEEESPGMRPTSVAFSYSLSLSLSLSLSVMSSSSSSSHGSEGRKEEEEMNSGDLTPLQKHVSFFDRNKDGVIYPWETFQGFRAIGCGVPLSTLSAVLINGSLGPKTRLGIIPSPLLPIYVKNIHKGKHGSDSGVYDSEGRFVPAKFEEIFKKHAHTNPNGLTSKELDQMLQANRVPKDHKGWFASWTEWKLLFSLCKDKDGLLHKKTIRAVYDGSLFLTMEEERKSSQKKA